MVQKTNSSAEAVAEIERMDALTKRAARQAFKRELAPVDHPVVECVVLPKGDGKISMGEHIGGLGTVHYEEDERFPCLLPNALALYEKGYVNFPGAREALRAAEEARKGDERAAVAAEEAYQRAASLAGV